MIKNIQIKNFKSLQNIQINCANLNILSGLNGMGKSSLIQTLLVLKQSYAQLLTEQKLILVGNYANIGNYADAIYHNFAQEEAFIGIDIDFRCNKTLCIQTQADYIDYKTYSEIPVTLAGSPMALFVNEALFSKRKFQYIQAERVGPRDELKVNMSEVDNKNLGTAGEFALQYFWERREEDIAAANLAHESIKNTLRLESQVNAWMSEISPNVKIKAEYSDVNKSSIRPLFAYSLGQDIKARNVGFGLSYTFPIVLVLLIAKEGDLLIIENPEAHLHAKGQSKLGEMMALSAQSGVQIFCETHSEHIINGMRIALKKQKISAQNAKVFYFTKTEKGEGNSIVFDIPITENARLNTKELYDNNITGFFDQIDTDLSIILGL
ncbi:MAG: AAA family ATPase [Bernardetiaceae bacterium]|nr:AAA family ATPase [Bernardetiaceae bacterium]